MARIKPTVWLGILFAVAFIVAVAYSTMGSNPFKCRVCITFNGRSDCRSASARTKEEAQRAAATTACASLASGMSESMRCENTPPTSVEWK